ncbi:hypothetical protein QVD17_30079 [Tagetes erecta]|uniref:Uncharacterized protein n=1 Tax=Tagetes erecta TaxID=13708 RepID=A0AAD8K0W1_TARER|nr:hypothetical protein QVD17_30079 [Tagetes erecta]
MSSSHCFLDFLAMFPGPDRTVNQLKNKGFQFHSYSSHLNNLSFFLSFNSPQIFIFLDPFSSLRSTLIRAFSLNLVTYYQLWGSLMIKR